MKAPHRVLVIRIGRLGDTILATPIIQVLREIYGRGVLVDFAVSPGAGAAILSLDQRINQVFPVARRNLPWYLNPSKRALRRQAKNIPYDQVFNLETGGQCDDFIEFIRFGAFYGRPLSVSVHVRGQHCVDTEKSIYADVLGVEATASAVPSLQIGHDVEGRSTRIQGDYVILNPGFSGVQKKGYRSHRRWPDSHWNELIDLIRRSGRDVALNGSAAERGCFESLLGQPGVHSLFGAPLTDLVAAMMGAHGLISVDTGSMHLASALGVPVLALFGPTDPGLTGPYRGNAISRVLTSGVDCQPCVRTPLQKRCGFNRCMQELSPESVFAAFERMRWQIPKPLNSPGRDQPSTS